MRERERACSAPPQSYLCDVFIVVCAPYIPGSVVEMYTDCLGMGVIRGQYVSSDEAWHAGSTCRME